MQKHRYNVVIGTNRYELTYLDGSKALILGLKLNQRFAPVIASTILGDRSTLVDGLKNCLDPEEMYDIIVDLIDPMTLTCNNALIDMQIHFRKRQLELITLAYHALKENYEDFFSLISGYVSQSTELQDILGTLKQLNADNSMNTKDSQPLDKEPIQARRMKRATASH